MILSFSVFPLLPTAAYAVVRGLHEEQSTRYFVNIYDSNYLELFKLIFSTCEENNKPFNWYILGECHKHVHTVLEGSIIDDSYVSV